MSLSDKNSHNSSEELPSKKEKVVMNDPNDQLRKTAIGTMDSQDEELKINTM